MVLATRVLNGSDSVLEKEHLYQKVHERDTVNEPRLLGVPFSELVLDFNSARVAIVRFDKFTMEHIVHVEVLVTEHSQAHSLIDKRKFVKKHLMFKGVL